MAEFSLTATDEQVRVIAFVLRRRNIERAAQDPPLPPLDMQGLFDAYLAEQVRLHSAEAIQFERDRLVEAYSAASQTERDAVNITLGLDHPP